MKPHFFSFNSRLLRRFILAGSIAPLAIGSMASAADVTWLGNINISINPNFAAGLHEGRLNGAFNETDANPNSAITLNPRLAENNGKPPWGDNETWVYTGEINAGPAGTLSFAENIDDNTLLLIDGVQVIRDTQWNVVATSGVLSFTPNTYHTFELRVGNGGGGAGPVGQNGFNNNYGFGVSQTGATSNQGTDYFNPADPGNGSLFRYRIASDPLAPDFVGGDTVHVTGDSTVTLQNVTGSRIVEQLISFEPAGPTLSLAVNRGNAAQASTLSSLATIVPASKTINILGTADIFLGAMTVGGNSIVTKNGGAGLLVLDNPTNSFAAGSILKVLDGTLSIVGNASNPVSSLASRIEIGQPAGPVPLLAPTLRVGSSGTASTNFSNRLDVRNDGTLQHTSNTTDTISGSVRVAAGKTFTVDVTNGQLNLSGLLLGGSSTLRKTGASTLLLNGAVQSLTSIEVQAGRVEATGAFSITTNPIIANGATLALRNPSGDNTLPSTISIPSGTLEGVPGAFGDAATALNLTGGRLRLSAVGNGLNAQIYNQAPPNVNNGIPGFDVYGTYTTFFAGLPAPNISVLTSFNGVTGLDYQGAPQYGVYGATFDDNIISRMSGSIFIPTTGSYTFGTSSDDGSVLFIDGSIVVSNNFFQGRTRRTGSVSLSAGEHTIDIGFYEGGGGNSFTVDWAGPGFGQMTLPNTSLFAGGSVATYNNPIDVQASSSIDVQVGNAIVPTLTIQPGRTLSVTGGTLTAPTVTLNGAGAYGFSGDGTIVASRLLDGGADVDITKSGAGVLVLDNTTTPQLQNPGSSVTVTGGQVGILLETGGLNPLGNASIIFAGGGVVLSSKGGDQTFPLPSFSGNGSVIARKVGSGVSGVTINLTGNLGVAAGQTVTLGTDNGYSLTVGGAATGTGTVVVTGTGVKVNSNTAFQALNVNIGGGTAASLTVNTDAPTFGTLAGQSANGVLLIGTGAGPATLTLSGGNNARYNGAINEVPNTVLRLIKNGSYTQTLGGTGNFTAGVEVNGGTLEIKSGAIGANNLTLGNGATLQFISAGLFGQFYAGDDGGAHNAFAGPDIPANTFASYSAYFAGRTTPFTGATTLNGRTNLSFNPGGGTESPFVDWGLAQGDNIVSRMTGKIVVPADGQYTFGTTSDDGSMLFIDGVKVVENNAYQGMTRRSGSVTLAAGLHDIDIGFYEGGGGAGLIADWAGPGFGTTVIPNSVVENLLTAYDGTLNPIAMLGSSTFDLRGGIANLGSIARNPGTTLTSTAGTLSFTQTDLNGAGAYAYNNAGTVVLGQINDSAAAITINKTGAGNLVFSAGLAQLTNAANQINATGGRIVAVLGTVNDPLGSSAVTLTDSGLGLSSTGGDVTTSRPLTVIGNVSLIAGNFGGGAVDGPLTATLATPISIATGKTATISSTNNYTLGIGNGTAGGITGAGNVTMTEGSVLVKNAINIGGALRVEKGTLTSEASITAGSVTIPDGMLALQAGTTLTASTVSVTNGILSLNGGANLASGGTTLSGLGRLELNTGTVTGPIGVSGGTIRVTTGGAVNLGNLVTFSTNTLANTLLGRYFNPVIGTGNSEAGVAAIQNRSGALAERKLTTALSFGPTSAGDGAISAYFGGVDAGAFSMGFFGKFTAPISGVYQAQVAQVDDDAGFWLDLDQDGVFELAGGQGNELISGRGCCGDGPIGNTPIPLVAGQTYKVAIAVQDGGGGGSLVGRAGLPGFGLGTVNPGDVNQAGFWSVDLPNNIEVQASATLDINSINGANNVFVDGSLDINGPGSSRIDNLVIGSGGIVTLGGGAPGPVPELASNSEIAAGSPQAVPEPGSFGLLLFGALGLLGQRRRVRQS